ncbi:MAG: flavodoxin family protein [Desulfatiglans sp.]|jgi:multimeric flavodoxin WrbA|nr:flavodoxin family protein [Desulfatiglans sp.]
MKILGLVCSPREEGNTEILVREALEGAQQKGAETELYLLHDKEISPCIACEACRDEGICPTDDDMQDLYEKLLDSDGIIFGTPVYFINVTAQAKAVIDRSFAFLLHGKLRGKTAAAIIAARRVGAGQVLSLMYTWFAVHGMNVAGGGIGYGRDKGEVREGPGGAPGLMALDEARSVGRNVVRTINRNRG